MESEKTSRQVVSKGRYAFNLGSKFALSSFGVLVFLIGGFCILCTCGLLGMGLMRFQWADLPLFVFTILFMGGLSISLLCFGADAVKEAKQTDAGVPLTHFNAANLPAPESLVRASEEPAQEQKVVLLRAAIETQEKHVEELVRASAERSEPARTTCGRDDRQ